MQVSAQNIRKILVIRFSSIGDIVLTTPVVRCLKQQSGAEVHFLTKKAYAPLLEANPHLDRVFVFEKKLSEVLPALKKERYDAVIDLHKNLRSLRVRLALGVRTFAFDKINPEKWLMVNLKINHLPPEHVVDRYMATVAPLGIRNDGLGLEFFSPPQTVAHDETVAQITNLSIHPFINCIVFAIGAAHQTKRLPTEQIIAICRSIQKPVVLLGGKNEAEEGETIARAAGGHVTNACGKLSLHESASVIRAAGKVITHDTGMMHIAAAFQKEILSIWGNTIPAFGMYPYYGNSVDKNTAFEVKNLSCRPCSKIGFDKCPKGHFQCMKNQDVAAISTEANR